MGTLSGERLCGPCLPHYGPKRASIAEGSSLAMQVMLNGSPHRFDPPPSTVAELVRALNLEGKRIAVEMNGEIVPKSRYAQTRVAAGDRLEVVAAVGGG